MEVRVDNIIKFLDIYCLGLRRGGYLDNGYDFSKKYFTTSKVL